jgi:hypothetical protein
MNRPATNAGRKIVLGAVELNEGVGPVHEDADHYALTPHEGGTVGAGSRIAVQETHDRYAAPYQRGFGGQLDDAEEAAVTSLVNPVKGWLLRSSA